MGYKNKNYEYNQIPINEDQLSDYPYYLKINQIDRISSLEIVLNKENKGGVLIIPDYSATEFQAARISGIPDISSGFIRFKNGVPISFKAIQPIFGSPNTYHLDFNDDFPRPKRFLTLNALPPEELIEYSISEIRIIRNDGKHIIVKLNPAPSFLFSLIIGSPLALLLIYFDKKSLAKAKLLDVDKIFEQRLILVRAFCLCVAMVLGGYTGKMLFSINSENTFLNIIIVIALLLCAAFNNNLLMGILPKNDLYHSRRYIAPTILLIVILIPMIFPGLYLIYFHRLAMDQFTKENVFHNRVIKRAHQNQKIIICLGGSSTQGTPFYLTWTYDYPRQLEGILQDRQKDVKVANAGVKASTSEYASKYLPRLIKAMHPDVVILNYMNNDSPGIINIFRPLLNGIRLSFIEDIHWRKYNDCLENIVRLLRSNNIPCVFILEPYYYGLYQGETVLVKTRNAILEVASKEGAIIVDPYPMFIQEKDRPLFVDKLHLTRFGCRLLAEIIADKINDLI